tara:strand:+ start:226 stop:741 length:516 start_codon:yes stop_codon:yes gene_type:complete
MGEEIRIYVADLAAYNNGILHGVWIDATLGTEDLFAAIKKMLEASPEEDSEEFAIHDYEGFGAVAICEYQGIESVHEIALFIEEYPALGAEVLNYYGGDLDDAREALEERYSGCYSSLADYAQEWTESTSDVPESLAYYIDYEAMGRDFELGGDIFTIETAHDEVHVFWAH